MLGKARPLPYVMIVHVRLSELAYIVKKIWHKYTESKTIYDLIILILCYRAELEKCLSPFLVFKSVASLSPSYTDSMKYQLSDISERFVYPFIL